jgi:hypothetical protein
MRRSINQSQYSTTTYQERLSEAKRILQNFLTKSSSNSFKRREGDLDMVHEEFLEKAIQCYYDDSINQLNEEEIIESTRKHNLIALSANRRLIELEDFEKEIISLKSTAQEYCKVRSKGLDVNLDNDYRLLCEEVGIKFDYAYGIILMKYIKIVNEKLISLTNKAIISEDELLRVFNKPEELSYLINRIDAVKFNLFEINEALDAVVNEINPETNFLAIRTHYERYINLYRSTINTVNTSLTNLKTYQSIYSTTELNIVFNKRAALQKGFVQGVLEEREVNERML